MITKPTNGYKRIKALPKALRVRRGIALLNLTPLHWRRGWGSAPRPGRFTPGERSGTHCTGCWLGPRAGLDGCGKSRLHRDSIPGPSSPQQVAIPTHLSRPPYKSIRVSYIIDTVCLLHVSATRISLPCLIFWMRGHRLFKKKWETKCV